MVADEVSIIADPRRHTEDGILLDVKERLRGAFLRRGLAVVVELRGHHRAVATHRDEAAWSRNQNFGASGSFNLACDAAVQYVDHADGSGWGHVGDQHEAAVRRDRQLGAV